MDSLTFDNYNSVSATMVNTNIFILSQVPSSPIVVSSPLTSTLRAVGLYCVVEFHTSGCFDSACWHAPGLSLDSEISLLWDIPLFPLFTSQDCPVLWELSLSVFPDSSRTLSWPSNAVTLLNSPKLNIIFPEKPLPLPIVLILVDKNSQCTTCHSQQKPRRLWAPLQSLMPYSEAL